jgi:hypothetical protein
MQRMQRRKQGKEQLGQLKQLLLMMMEQQTVDSRSMPPRHRSYIAVPLPLDC